MKDEKTIETYNKIAAQYSSAHFDHFWIDEFDFFSHIVPGKKVIDIGCGAGRDAFVFVENNFDYLGIDASEGMVGVASNRVMSGEFRVMDFYHLDFPPETFDGFWAAASLLHIPKIKIAEVLKSIYPILKKGGAGFISVKEKKDFNEGFVKENKYGGSARYFAFYTQGEFKIFLENAGFEVVKISTHPETDPQKTNWLCYFVKK
jgi:ubiquinone/menaquinone biosynthesis C-methylase UbiE